MDQSNPLKQYFRQIKMYIKLPSGTTYYSPETVEFTASGELGILPMTGKDELALKNPDGLLNGEALAGVITSCVPGVKLPRSLLTNDIDALITAIRFVTFNDTLETELRCPECGEINNFALDLQQALDNMTYLEADYVVNLDSGVSVFVRPSDFGDMLLGLHAQFEQNKLARTIEDSDMTDLQKTAAAGKSFKEMTRLTYVLMQNSVIKVVDDANGVNVTNKEHIAEFLFNIDNRSADKITEMIKEISAIGVKRSFVAKCIKCEHEWENDIDFNPVNFS